MTDELDVDDILDNVDLLAPHQTREIQEFLEAPELESFKKIRNDLLQTQDALDHNFICWNAAFLKAVTEDQRNANPSKEFDKRVAEKKNRQDQLQKSIVTVSKQWGKEIVKHYYWILEGEHYCNKLRTIALMIPKWSEAVEILNQSLVERVAIHASDKRIKKVEGANSIRLWDLRRITKAISGTNVPPTRFQRNELPDGYGRDRFGLIVEARFAKDQVALLKIKASDFPRDENRYLVDQDGSIVLSRLLSEESSFPKLQSTSSTERGNTEASNTKPSLRPSRPSYRSLFTSPSSDGGEVDNTENADADGTNIEDGTECAADVIDDTKMAGADGSEASNTETETIATEQPFASLRSSYSRPTTQQQSSPYRSPHTPRHETPTAPSSSHGTSAVGKSTPSLGGPDTFISSSSSPPIHSSPTLVAPSSPQLERSALLLDEHTRLNDKEINGYIGPLARQEGFCFLNSHFLNQYEPDMQKWRGEHGDPFNSNIVLMPVHIPDIDHWILLAMYKPFSALTDSERIVCILDSLNCKALHDKTYDSWLRYLRACGFKGQVEQRQITVPQQTNDSDCGVYVLAFAKQIAEQAIVFAKHGDLNWAIKPLEFRRTLAAATIASGPVDSKIAAANKATENEDDIIIIDASDTLHEPTIKHWSKRKCDSPAPTQNTSSSSSPADPSQSTEGAAVEGECVPWRKRRKRMLTEDTGVDNDGAITDVGGTNNSSIVTDMATYSDDSSVIDFESKIPQAPSWSPMSPKPSLNVPSHLQVCNSALANTPTLSFPENLLQEHYTDPTIISPLSPLPSIHQAMCGHSPEAALHGTATQVQPFSVQSANLHTICTMPNLALSTSSPSQQKNVSSMEISSIINPPNPHNRTLGMNYPVEDKAVSLIDENSVYVTSTTTDGWGPTFRQINFVLDFEHNKVFNVPDTRDLAPEPVSQLKIDLSDLRGKGFSHWNDNLVAEQIGILKKSFLWSSEGLAILCSILGNARLQNVTKQWFRSTPCTIWHCSWWHPTGDHPVYLKRNTVQNNDRCLVLHILSQDTVVQYFTGSHTATWPEPWLDGSPSFLNLSNEIQQYTKSKQLSSGLTIFDPTINFEIHSGYAMTIILGPRNESVGWTRLEVKDEAISKILERMEQTTGIGWNLTELNIVPLSPYFPQPVHLTPPVPPFPLHCGHCDDIVLVVCNNR